MKKKLKSQLTLSDLQVKNIYLQTGLSSKTLKPLFFNRCFDKNRIKLLVSWSLKTCGQKITINLIENLKNLGFQYATQAGISLGIDDLRIPSSKNTLISTAEKNIKQTSINSKQEYLTGIEKFQHLIDTWHRTSEILKQDVILNFQLTDVLNPVYMMAFSGARGNVSQVRQLVGMRGLMSDPQGQILDFPIKSNFREGITLTEYIISCYGARKGLVDTALKTANSGYLTRRLVDVSHHIIVCDFDCKTKRGVFIGDILENKKIVVALQNRLIGRILAEDIYSVGSSINTTKKSTCFQKLKQKLIYNRKFEKQDKEKLYVPSNNEFVIWRGDKKNQERKNFFSAKQEENVLEIKFALFCYSLAKHVDVNKKTIVYYEKQFSLFFNSIILQPKLIAKKNQEISVELAKKIVEIKKLVFVRSPLTCEMENSICQLCYGWSLAHGNLVSLGEAVGVIAAQSIGEPGTQLTMRTFHTGGVFSGDIMNEIVAPFPGRIIFHDFLQGMLIRTPHGKIAFLTKQQGSFELEMSDTEATKKPIQVKNTIFQIPSLSVLFIRNHEYVTKKQILAEFSLMATDANQRIQASYDLNAEIEGELLFKNLLLLIRKKRKTKEIISRTTYKFGCVWILSGKMCMEPIPINLFSQPGDLVDKNSIIAQYETMSSYSGFVYKHNFFSSFGCLSKSRMNFFAEQKNRQKTKPNNDLYYSFLDKLKIKKESINLPNNKIVKKWSHPNIKFVKKQQQLYESASQNWLEYPLLSYPVESLQYKKIGYFFLFLKRKESQLNSHKFFLLNSRNQEFKNSRHLNKSFFLKSFPNQYQTKTGGQLIYDNFYFKNQTGEIFLLSEETHFTSVPNCHKTFINYLIKTSYNKTFKTLPGFLKQNTRKFIFQNNSTSFYYNSQGKFSILHSKLFGYIQSYLVSNLKNLACTNDFSQKIESFALNVSLQSKKTFKVKNKETNPRVLFQENFNFTLNVLFGIKNLSQIKLKLRKNFFVFPFKAQNKNYKLTKTRIIGRKRNKTRGGEKIYSFHYKFHQVNFNVNPLSSENLSRFSNLSVSNLMEKLNLIFPLPISLQSREIFNFNSFLYHNENFFCTAKSEFLDFSKTRKNLCVNSLFNLKTFNTHIYSSRSFVDLSSSIFYTSKQSRRLKDAIEKNKLALKKLSLQTILQFYSDEKSVKVNMKLFTKQRFSSLQPQFPWKVFSKQNKKIKTDFQSYFFFNEKEKNVLFKFFLNSLKQKDRKNFLSSCLQNNVSITKLKPVSLAILKKQNKTKNKFIQNKSKYLKTQYIKSFNSRAVETCHNVSTLALLKPAFMEKKEHSNFNIKYIKIKIKPGWVYFPESFYEISQKHQNVLKPGEICFNTILFDQYSVFCQWVSMNEISIQNKKYLITKNTNLKKQIQFKNILKKRESSKCSSYNFHSLNLQNNQSSIINIFQSETVLPTYVGEKRIYSEQEKVNSANYELIKLQITDFSHYEIITLNEWFRNIFSLKLNSSLFFTPIGSQNLSFFAKQDLKDSAFKNKTLLEKKVKFKTETKETYFDISQLFYRKKKYKKKFHLVYKKILVKNNIKNNFLKKNLDKIYFLKNTNFKPATMKNFINTSFTTSKRNILNIKNKKILKLSTEYLNNNLTEFKNNNKNSLNILCFKINKKAYSSLQQMPIFLFSTHDTINSNNKSFSLQLKNINLRKSIPFNQKTFMIFSKVKSYSFQTITQYKKLLNQENQVDTNGSMFCNYQNKTRKNSDTNFIKLAAINKQNITHLFRNSTSPDFYLKFFFKFQYSKQTLFYKKISILQYNIIFIIPKKYKFIRTKIFFVSKLPVLFAFESKIQIANKTDFQQQNLFTQNSKNKLVKQKRKIHAETLTSFNVSMFIELEDSNQNVLSKRNLAFLKKPGNSFQLQLNLNKKIEKNESSLSMNKPIFGSKLLSSNLSNNQINTKKLFFSLENYISPEIPLKYTNSLSPHYGEILYSGLYRDKKNPNIKKRKINLDPSPNQTEKQNYLILTSNEQVNFAINNFDSKLKIRNKFKNLKSRYSLGERISYGTKLSSKLIIPISGVIIQIEKSKITVRKAQPISFNAKGLISVYQGDIVEKNTLIIRLFYQRLKTGDIVQGIPKIEQLFEARKTNQGEVLSGSLHEQLERIFLYYTDKYNFSKAARYSLEKIQQIIVSSIQNVYRSQGVLIHDKHLEIIIRQMTSKVEVIESGQTSLLPGEIVDLDWIEVVNKSLEYENTKAKYVPIIFGITRKSLETKSFISEASFQETTRVLTKSSIERRTDFLRGLKENVILGHLVPAGTGFQPNELRKKFFHSIGAG